jgi:hypothetical protein
VLARILLAEALLEFLLGLVARHVHCKEGMVVFLALSPELDPFSVGRLVPDNLALKPASELAIAISSPRLAVTDRRVPRFFRSWVGWLVRVRNGEFVPANCSVAI